MMLWKNRNKRVGLYVMVVTSCLVMATLWAVLATPETALAKKPVKPDDMIYYSVTMEGDLTIVGAFSFDDGVCSVVAPPSDDWGRTFNKGILVNSPLPAVCIANAFLETGDVTLVGEPCDDGVIPCGNGPNWGTLLVEWDKNAETPEVIVTYYIGETDIVTGKCRRYTLTSDSGILTTTDAGDVYITIESGTKWSLVQAKPGKLNMTLSSTQDTVIEFETGP